MAARMLAGIAGQSVFRGRPRRLKCRRNRHREFLRDWKRHGWRPRFSRRARWENLGSIATSHATGVATVGDGGWAGGLAGQNLGSIATSYATGVVTVGDGGWAGGLVGRNFANAAITGSHAEGNVIAGNSAFAGGLVGSNGAGPGSKIRMRPEASPLRQHGLSGRARRPECRPHRDVSCDRGRYSRKRGLGRRPCRLEWRGSEIENSYATGTVSGAAGADDIKTLGGLAGTNQGLISGSWASGNVGSPLIANLQAGGLVGSNFGTIQSSSALGNVQAGDGGIAGGLVATNLGTITDSSATGAIVSGGTLSLVGGLVGTNPGTIAGSSASGAVSVGSNGTAGGLVAFNTGSITNALRDRELSPGAAGAGGITTHWAGSPAPIRG